MNILIIMAIVLLSLEMICSPFILLFIAYMIFKKDDIWPWWKAERDGGFYFEEKWKK